MNTLIKRVVSMVLIVCMLGSLSTVYAIESDPIDVASGTSLTFEATNVAVETSNEQQTAIVKLYMDKNAQVASVDVTANLYDSENNTVSGNAIPNTIVLGNMELSSNASKFTGTFTNNTISAYTTSGYNETMDYDTAVDGYSIINLPITIENGVVGKYTVVFSIDGIGDDTFDLYSVTNDTVTATITISEPAAPAADYEIYYELDSDTDEIGANGAVGSDNFMEYGINDQVTATVYMKNNTSADVTMQAYDIYLTYSDKLAYESNTLDGAVAYAAGKEEAFDKENGDAVVDHIQLVKGTKTIELPGDGTAVSLGTIVFSLTNGAVYGEDLAINLDVAEDTTNNAKAEEVTNFSVGGAVAGDAANGEGDATSYYPMDISTVKGAEVDTTYTVTFDANGGVFEDDAVTSQTKQYNVGLTLAPSIPSRDGYTFKGWSTESGDNNTVNAGTTYTGNEDEIFYAVWEQNSFTVTWYQSDNATAHHTETIASGTVGLTAPSTSPEKADTAEWDYTFIGWNTDKTATDKMDLSGVTVNSDLEFYPIYSSVKQTYTVTWYNYDGTQLHKDESVEYGTTPSYDGQTPTKADSTDGQFKYTHDGWSATKDGDKLDNLPAVDGNEEFYAVFKEETKSYTITYAAGTGTFTDGDNAETEEAVRYGNAPAAVPAVTAPNGYCFTGWSDGVKTYGTDLSDYTVTGAVTLTAQYTANDYIITLNPDGGIIADMTADNDGNYSLEYNITSTETLPSATKTGYAFAGWKLETTVDGWEANTYGANTSVTGKWGNVTLVAQWTEDAHEVKQSADVKNGTATPSVNTAKEGDVVTVTITPAEGYKFDENDTVTYIYTDAEGTQHTETITVTDTDSDGIYIGTFTMPDYAVEITATFTSIDYTITVTVEPSGTATVTPSKTPANVNDEITLTASSIKDGYQLKEYTATNASTNEEITVVDGKFTMPAANVEVTATFEGKLYEITYDPNGGENSMTATQGIFGTATELSANAFAKTGYTFAGWTATEGGTTAEYTDEAEFNPQTYATSYKLYAVWEANTYTVTLNANGGKVNEKDTDTITVTYDSEYGDELVDPVRTGYTFDGWYADSSFSGSKIERSTTVAITEDQTLYAKWTPSEYTVTLKPEGGNFDGSTENKVETVTYDKEYTLTEPTRDGYTFAGWKDENGEDFEPGEKVDFTDNLTLMAKWSVVPYTITFDLNGGAWPTDATISGTTMSYNIESTDSLPTAERIYYTFTGWKVTTTVEGSTVWAKDAEIDAGTAVTGKYGDVTLTAQWSRAAAPVVEDYKYAADGYYMIRVADTLDTTQEYKFNGESMYWIEDSNYAVNGNDKVFYYLVEAQYVDTDKDTLNDAGYALLSTGDVVNGARSTITYNGDVNGDDVLNIADANVVYQMTVYGGAYYNSLSVEQRLHADMAKSIGDTNNDHRGSIADVNVIVNKINGVTN